VAATTREGGLAPYRRTVTSQDGEDGIIEHIFARVPPASRSCVEFGAWDGKHLSNVWNLWANLGWNAVLVEADPRKHAELEASIRERDNVRALCSYVTEAGPTRLDALLAATPLPRPLDLLSIDIDGNEHAVWESVADYRARVVIVEHNPTIPPHVELVTRGRNYVGSSARSLVDLGRRLGYELVACTMTNCIFVSSELYPALEIEDNDLARLFDDSLLTWVMSSYSGELFLSRAPAYLDPALVPPGLEVRRPNLIGRAAELGRRVFGRRVGHSFGPSVRRLKGPLAELLFVLRDD
jgi:hypothetical protein